MDSLSQGAGQRAHNRDAQGERPTERSMEVEYSKDEVCRGYKMWSRALRQNSEICPPGQVSERPELALLGSSEYQLCWHDPNSPGTRKHSLHYRAYFQPSEWLVSCQQNNYTLVKPPLEQTPQGSLLFSPNGVLLKWGKILPYCWLRRAMVWIPLEGNS